MGLASNPLLTENTTFRGQHRDEIGNYLLSRLSSGCEGRLLLSTHRLGTVDRVCRERYASVVSLFFVFFLVVSIVSGCNIIRYDTRYDTQGCQNDGLAE